MAVKDFIDIKNYIEPDRRNSRSPWFFVFHVPLAAAWMNFILYCTLSHRLTMAKSDDKFYCDCSKYCKRRKQVSAATWYNHTEHCGAVMMTFAAFSSADTSSMRYTFQNLVLVPMCNSKQISGSMSTHFYAH
jgi:hypothetical protein